MKTISVVNDFSEFPGLRNCDISDNSGEDFYHKVLNRAFKDAFEEKTKLQIDLDNTAGYASSFLDEAFGNLVYDFTLELVKKTVEIISEQEPHWKEMIEMKTYAQWEERRKAGLSPKVTIDHPAWYRMIGNEIKSSVWEQPVVA